MELLSLQLDEVSAVQIPAGVFSAGIGGGGFPLCGGWACLLMTCTAKLVFWAKEAFGVGVRKGHKTIPGDEEPGCQGVNTVFFSFPLSPFLRRPQASLVGADTAESIFVLPGDSGAAPEQQIPISISSCQQAGMDLLPFGDAMG